MNGHPQFDEDFDLYALGALDPEERLAIESHIKDCAGCANKLTEARGRIALMAAAAPPVDPSTAVKQRLMARLGESSSAERKAKSESRPATFRRRPVAAWALALAAVIVAAVLAFSNDRLNQQIRELRAGVETQQATVNRARTVLDLLTAPDTQRVTLIAASVKPEPEGRVYYRPDRGMLFYAANLPAPPDGRVYQLWLVPVKGSPISAGVFEPDDKGNASIILPKLPVDAIAKAFAVTVEPAGGVPQPTGPKILIGTS